MRFTPVDVAVQFLRAKTDISAAVVKRWNVAAAVIYVVEAMAILVAARSYTLPINLTFLTSDTLQTTLTGKQVLAPAVHELIRMNVAYLLAVVLLLAAIVPALSATVLGGRYSMALKRRASSLRWVQLAISAGLMAATLGLLVGVYDLATLVLLASIAAMTFMLGFNLEMATIGGKQQKAASWLAAGMGIKGAVIALCAIGLYLLSSAVFGTAGIPSANIWLYATVTIFFASVITNAHLTCTKRGHWADYAFADCWYIGLQVLGVSLFAWEVFWAVLR